MATTHKRKSRKKAAARTAGKKSSRRASRTARPKRSVASSRKSKARKPAKTSKVRKIKTVAKKKAGVRPKAVARKKATARRKAAKKKASSRVKAVSRKKSTTSRKGAGTAARTAASRKKAGKARTTRTKETSVAKRRGKNFESIRKMLFERREQVLRNLGRLTGAASQASSRPVGDRVDDAVTDLEVDSTYAIAEQEAQELRLIDTALEHIENGTYGVCEECGNAIEKPRLKALPYAVLCLKCKQAEEMQRAAGGAY